MALISIPICLWFGEFYAVKPFLETAIASLVSAQLLWRFGLPKVEETRLYHAMLIVALTWGLIPLVGSIPFLGIARALAPSPTTPETILTFQSGWNALFESFSGFTGTGLSMAKNASVLPHSLQWWRSFTEWVDGAGIVILMLAVLKSELLEADPSQLYSATGRQKTIADTVRDTAKDIVWIYSFYTGLSILLLASLGMPLWEAINHGLTGIATGGFGITENSITGYSPLIQLAIVLIMITGAIGFPIHYQLLRHQRWSVLWQSAQHQMLWLFLGLGSVILLLETRWFSGSFLWIDTLFQWTSALTTCGFSTTDIKEWSAPAKLLLSAAMIVGGTAGSTAGGLKLKRIVTLYQGIRWRFQQFFLHGKDSIHYHLDGEELTEAQAHHKVQHATVLIVLWLILLGVGTFVLFHLVGSDYRLGDVMFEAASATSNVGLSTGISSSSLHWGGKLVLILLMWLGRLEIIPVLLLFISTARTVSQMVYRNLPPF